MVTDEPGVSPPGCTAPSFSRSRVVFACTGLPPIPDLTPWVDAVFNDPSKPELPSSLEPLSGKPTQATVIGAVDAVQPLWERLKGTPGGVPYREVAAVDHLLRGACGVHPRASLDEAQKVGGRVMQRVRALRARLVELRVPRADPPPADEVRKLTAQLNKPVDDILDAPDAASTPVTTGVKRPHAETGVAALAASSPLARMPLATTSNSQQRASPTKPSPTKPSPTKPSPTRQRALVPASDFDVMCAAVAQERAALRSERAELQKERDAMQIQMQIDREVTDKMLDESSDKEFELRERLRLCQVGLVEMDSRSQSLYHSLFGGEVEKLQMPVVSFALCSRAEFDTSIEQIASRHHHAFYPMEKARVSNSIVGEWAGQAESSS